MTTKDQCLLAILSTIDAFARRYPNREYLCTWYSLEIHGPMSKYWPGFGCGSPWHHRKRAVAEGLVEAITLPSTAKAAKPLTAKGAKMR